MWRPRTGAWDPARSASWTGCLRWAPGEMKRRRDMNTLPLLRFEVIVGLLVLAAPGVSWAQEQFNVKALRTDRVDLYDCGDEKRKTGQELTRAGFSGPLPAKTVSGSSIY